MPGHSPRGPRVFSFSFLRPSKVIRVPSLPPPHSPDPSLPSSLPLAKLYVLLFGIQLVKHLHTLFINGKHNPSTHHQPSQPRDSTTPQRPNTFLLDNPHCTVYRVPILFLCLDRLHSSLNTVEGLSDIHCNYPRYGADPECRYRAEFLPGSNVRLGELTQGGVDPESRG